MTEPLNISHPYDWLWAGYPYDPTSAKSPDDPATPGSAGSAAPAPRSAPPPQPPPESPTVWQLVRQHIAPKPATWYVQKAQAEAACLLPCSTALRAAELKMQSGGLAEKMLEHFRSGSRTPVRVDLNVELQRNPQLREYITSRIQWEMNEKTRFGDRVEDMAGAIWVPQSTYGPTDAGRDQQLALGGTYFEYQVVASAPGGKFEVRVNIADHYFWSPSEKERPTNCLHVCGDNLVSAGKATEFYQFGEGSLIVDAPTRASGRNVLEVEAPDDL